MLASSSLALQGYIYILLKETVTSVLWYQGSCSMHRFIQKARLQQVLMLVSL